MYLTEIPRVTFFGVGLCSRGHTFQLFAASDLFLLTVALRLGLLLARRHVTDLVNRTKRKTHTYIYIYIRHWAQPMNVFGALRLWRRISD